MPDRPELTDEQVGWLKRLLENQSKSPFDRTPMPADIQEALAERGLVRRWRNGDAEITLAGMVAVANRLSLYRRHAA